MTESKHPFDITPEDIFEENNGILGISLDGHEKRSIDEDFDPVKDIREQLTSSIDDFVDSQTEGELTYEDQCLKYIEKLSDFHDTFRDIIEMKAEVSDKLKSFFDEVTAYVDTVKAHSLSDDTYYQLLTTNVRTLKLIASMRNHSTYKDKISDNLKVVGEVLDSKNSIC